MVSNRVKKKLACETSFRTDRICQYCSKEFHYPSVLKRHLRLKNMCSKQASQATDLVSQIVSQANQTTDRVSDRVSPASDRISDQINEKNTVPIRLILA